MIWQDISSYSRGEVRGEPKTVQCRAGAFRIIVTRHIHSPGKWFLDVPGVYELWELKATELEAAKAEALAEVRRLLEKVLETIP